MKKAIAIGLVAGFLAFAQASPQPPAVKAPPVKHAKLHKLVNGTKVAVKNTVTVIGVGIGIGLVVVGSGGANVKVY